MTNGTTSANDNLIIFSKSSKEAIGVSLKIWKEQLRVDIRTYVPVIGEEGLMATPKGISLTAEKYPELLQAVRALGDVMSNDKVVARISKNENQEIRVGVNTFRNMPLIYIRTFTKKKGDADEWSPSRKGISIKVDLYPRLLEAVESLQDQIN